MPCLLILLPLWMVVCIIAQMSTLRRLLQLVRHPQHIVNSGLATNCVVVLCIVSGVVLFGLATIVGGIVSYFGPDDILTSLIFSHVGIAFSFCSWVVMTGWLAMTIARPESLYRSPVSLVPIVILALICLIFLLGFGWAQARMILQNSSLITAQASWGQLVAGLILVFLFYIPTAPLVGFVLLIIHVARMLPSGKPTANGGLESEGDMS